MGHKSNHKKDKVYAAETSPNHGKISATRSSNPTVIRADDSSGMFLPNGSLVHQVSVSQIRQSRQKVELDVLRLHNRIQLLEAEEERAVKIIEDTKQKVK